MRTRIAREDIRWPSAHDPDFVIGLVANEYAQTQDRGGVANTENHRGDLCPYAEADIGIRADNAVGTCRQIKDGGGQKCESHGETLCGKTMPPDRLGGAGRNLSASCGIDGWSWSEVEKPNPLAAPITTFADSMQRLITQVIG